MPWDPPLDFSNPSFSSSERNRYIVINNSIDEVSAKFVCAHEIGDDKFLELVSQNFTYSQIASALNVKAELVMIKAQLLTKKGYKLNIPYIPQANFLGNM